MREAELPISRRIVRALDDARARLLLRAADRIGARPRVEGAPWVENLGRIEIGDDLVLRAAGVRSHFVTGVGAELRIGDAVTIGPAAAIAATTSIIIGDGAWLGAAVLIMDSDYHDSDRRSEPGATAPIVIGEGARIGDGVTILKGSHVGARACIAAGSVVSGVIPDGAEASGVPARVARRGAPGGREVIEEVRRVVGDALAVDHALTDAEPLADLDGWDSLAALRLVVSLEEAFGARLPDVEIVHARDVAALAAVVTSHVD